MTGANKEIKLVNEILTDNDIIDNCMEYLSLTDYSFKLYVDIQNRFWVECKHKSIEEPIEIFLSDIKKSNKIFDTMNNLGNFPEYMIGTLKRYLNCLRNAGRFERKSMSPLRNNKLLLLLIETYKELGLNDNGNVLFAERDKVYLLKKYTTKYFKNDAERTNYAKELFENKIITNKSGNEYISIKKLGNSRTRYYCFDREVLKYVK
jgi:hypothetical protein